MCGIAGIIALCPASATPRGALRRMADALAHRGPDDEGVLETGGIGLACRRLSIVDLAGGSQPVFNEDGSVAAVFNGEIFDHADARRALEARGHRFRTRCDTELIPHLWEEHGLDLFDRLRGQFAFALYDARARQLVLARDRFGICPLYWTVQSSAAGRSLLFASEIRALLASGLVRARPDLRGIDQVFHFLAAPGPATCFEGVSLLQPGHFISVSDPQGGTGGAPAPRAYWSLDFPRRGDVAADQADAPDLFDEALREAVERRLQADVPVGCYLSGGIDSSVIAAMAARARTPAPPAFTARVEAPKMDESAAAATVLQHVGAEGFVVRVGAAEVRDAYPEVVRAAEAPVIDTAAAATLLLAREVRARGYKVVLTGEGADEWLGGYPWHKIHRVLGGLDWIPHLQLSAPVRRFLGVVGGVPARARARIEATYRRLGHYSAFHDLYALMTAARYVFFNGDALRSLDGHDPYLELQPDLERINRWHPLDQSAYWGARVHLAGHLLSLKGDRMAMHSSVETRYPFLDERVVALIAGLHPRWKVRGLREKHILRVVGERYLPRAIAWQRKRMFLAPLDSFFATPSSSGAGFVSDLISDESLNKTGLFDARAVRRWERLVREDRVARTRRTVVHLGMVGVIATQLWYQTFIDGTLADLPSDAGGSRRAPATNQV